jgi:hypothetical protein
LTKFVAVPSPNVHKYEFPEDEGVVFVKIPVSAV